jgi:hypothetical protein
MKDYISKSDFVKKAPSWAFLTKLEIKLSTYNQGDLLRSYARGDNMKTASKILILSVLTFFLLGGSALAVSLSDNLPQNYFYNTSLELKSVDYQMMPMNYLLVGENLAANYDINNIPEDEVIDASDDETIATQWSSNYQSNYQIFHSATRALASYGSEVAEDADSCMFVGDIVELSIVPSVPFIDTIASIPEPATIVLMGFGLFGLGGWARRLQKTKEI